MSQTVANNSQEWLKILGKGMVTLPKKWREELGVGTGDIVKAKKEGDKIVIEAPQQSKKTPYRVYSDSEIDEFLEEDKLTTDFAKKVQKDISSLQK